MDKGIWGCLSSLHSKDQTPKFRHYSREEFRMSGLLKTSSEVSGMPENVPIFSPSTGQTMVWMKGTACTTSGEGSTSTCAAQPTAATSPGTFMVSSDVPTTTTLVQQMSGKAILAKFLQASGFRDAQRRSRSADDGMAIPTSGDAQGKGVTEI